VKQLGSTALDTATWITTSNKGKRQLFGGDEKTMVEQLVFVYPRE